ncbi:MAG TPA: hypothetical protein VG736_12765 [Vicinamibacterales bacterium]|jgi:hypothetical protein|nr:hypothetical protein [Vicinamibacterales bacterium]
MTADRATLFMGLLAMALAAGCRPQAPEKPAGAPTPVYNKDTGVLEQLVSDRNGDGKPDTRAFMEGTRIVRIEIDRDGDGRPDRWEYYSKPLPDGRPTTIERADEANGADGTTVTRHEIYDQGALRSVEEDTDDDGRIDKWESYEYGHLSRVDLDLAGKGKPTRRLTYDATGAVTSVEVDPDGDGVFSPAPANGADRPAGPGTSR